MCSLLKRLVSELKWDEKIDGTNMEIIMNINKRVDECDPMGGVWSVPKSKTGHVWCGASSLAICVCLEVDYIIVEDNCWMKKTDNVCHINLAESEAVLKGVNLALAWG